MNIITVLGDVSNTYSLLIYYYDLAIVFIMVFVISYYGAEINQHFKIHKGIINELILSWDDIRNFKHLYLKNSQFVSKNFIYRESIEMIANWKIYFKKGDKEAL